MVSLKRHTRRLPQTSATDGADHVLRCRQWALDVLDELWDTVCADRIPDERLRARYRLSAMHACRSARQAVERLYEAAGTSAIYATSPLDQALRDQMTIAAHAIASSRNLEPAGRVLMGLPANAALF